MVELIGPMPSVAGVGTAGRRFSMGTLRMLLVASFAAVSLLFGVSDLRGATAPFQARGLWICCGPVVAGTLFVIKSGTNSNFSGSDEGTNGSVLGTITGHVTGKTITIVWTYKKSPYAGGSQNLVASISERTGTISPGAYSDRSAHTTSSPTQEIGRSRHPARTVYRMAARSRAQSSSHRSFV